MLGYCGFINFYLIEFIAIFVIAGLLALNSWGQAAQVFAFPQTKQKRIEDEKEGLLVPSWSQRGERTVCSLYTLLQILEIGIGNEQSEQDLKCSQIFSVYRPGNGVNWYSITRNCIGLTMIKTAQSKSLMLGYCGFINFYLIEFIAIFVANNLN